MEFLQANSKALALTLEASKRPFGAFDGSTLRSLTFVNTEQALGRLLSISARQLTSEEKLDEAFERYLALLHLQRTYEDFGHGAFLYFWYFDDFPFWAASPAQTRERIVRAIKKLDAFEATLPPASDYIEFKYVEARRSLVNDPLGSLVGQRDYKAGDFLISNLAALLPGERDRAMRLLEVFAARDFDLMNRLSNALTHGEPALGILESTSGDWLAPTWVFQDFRRWPLWLQTTPLRSPINIELGANEAYWLVWCETRRRATHLLMAIEAWKLDHHGELPNELEDLVGDYVDQLPLDPYTGRPFLLAHEGLSQSPRFTTEALFRPQKPFIWSTGPNVRLSEPPPGYDKHKSRQQPALRTCFVADRTGVTSKPRTWHSPVSDDEIWLSGNWFEIP